MAKRHPLPFANPQVRKTQNGQLSPAEQQFDAQFGNKHNEPVPIVKEDPVWTLADVVGPERADAIEKSGVLSFHTVGDTGFDSYPFDKKTGQTRWDAINRSFQLAEENLVSALSGDVRTDSLIDGPAFLFHLGDVNYFDNTREGYNQQFYEPFAGYPNKIIAVPGNHDCEIKLSQQQFMLQAFLENFCQPDPGVPPSGRHSSPAREMVAQPGVFWRLDSKLVQIIGLCSNVGEEGGDISGPDVGPEMYAWFKKTLADVKNKQDMGDYRRALIVALHHPPYTKGNHQPSQAMNQALDAAFKGAGIWPDLILAAHDHNAQRFTRYLSFQGKALQIPYSIYGGGGRAQGQKSSSPTPPDPFPDVHVEHFGHGNGYAIITVGKQSANVEYRPLGSSDANRPDRYTVDLRNRTVR
jgi:calcineurin-like phosphoesterase family protein